MSLCSSCTNNMSLKQRIEEIKQSKNVKKMKKGKKKGRRSGKNYKKEVRLRQMPMENKNMQLISDFLDQNANNENYLIDKKRRRKESEYFIKKYSSSGLYQDLDRGCENLLELSDDSPIKNFRQPNLTSDMHKNVFNVTSRSKDHLFFENTKENSSNRGKKRPPEAPRVKEGEKTAAIQVEKQMQILERLKDKFNNDISYKPLAISDINSRFNEQKSTIRKNFQHLKQKIEEKENLAMKQLKSNFELFKVVFNKEMSHHTSILKKVEGEFELLQGQRVNDIKKEIRVCDCIQQLKSVKINGKDEDTKNYEKMQEGIFEDLRETLKCFGLELRLGFQNKSCNKSRSLSLKKLEFKEKCVKKLIKVDKDTSKKTKKRQQHIFKTKKREVNRKVSMKLDSTRLKFERFKKDLRAKRDLRTSFNVKKANACFGKKRSATPLGYRTANKIDFRESASSFTRTKRKNLGFDDILKEAKTTLNPFNRRKYSQPCSSVNIRRLSRSKEITKKYHKEVFNEFFKEESQNLIKNFLDRQGQDFTLSKEKIRSRSNKKIPGYFN